MKNFILRCKFLLYLIPGIMFLFCSSGSIAQEFDTDVPMGWAVVPGYATDYTGGVQTTTGGAGGEVVTVTTQSQLASYANDDVPRIIMVQGTLTGTDKITVGSNKTIIGVGSDAKLSGFYINMNPSKNVIIRNLEISGGTDAIAARYTDHLWVDHCYLHTCTDGLLDITRESDRFAVTWNKFADHNKCNLLNGGSTHIDDTNKINGTVHHNYYYKTVQRNPRVGFGMVHVFNDYNYSNSEYGIGFHSRAKVLIEKNYFKDMGNCIQQMYPDSPEALGDALARDNVFDNASGDESTGKAFEPTDYYKYDFLMDSANDVASIVSAGAGPSAEYATIGLMPTPGQGALIDLTDATLSWKTGVVSPKSYIVYFGTTTNPPQVATTTGTSYTATISEKTVYYWRVDQVTASDTIQGKLWVFVTGAAVSGVDLTPSTALVGVNSTKQLTANISPSDAKNKNVTWYSSNTSVATVNQSGLVSGIGEGSAAIAVTTEEGSFSDTCYVTVSIIPATGVNLLPDSASFGIGKTLDFNAEFVPSDASNKNVTWSSSDPSVATVDPSGLVTGISEGTAYISIITQDGGFKDSSFVKVTKFILPTPLISLSFNENTGSTVLNTGSVPATFGKTDPPSWSANVPSNGGTSSLDFGTTSGNYYVQSSAVISELAGMASFSVTGWVNCKNISVGSGGNRIVSWINNGGNGVDIVHDDNGSLKVGINEWPDQTIAISSTGKITANSDAPAANWKYFAVTYESSTSTLKFYFGDNTTQASLDKTINYDQGTVGASIGKLAIGHFNDESSRTSRSDRMFKGLIDNVEIYGSELSLLDIQSIQKEVRVMPALSISKTKLFVADTANSTVTFDITSNTDWTVSSNESWLIPDVTSGSNIATITLTASANTSTSLRTATVTVAGTDVASQAITVTQAVGTATGINETGNTDVVFYPNPVSSVLTIPGLAQNSTVLINDINGKCVKFIRATSGQIDVSSLSQGIYFLKIEDQKGIIVRKFIKQ